MMKTTMAKLKRDLFYQKKEWDFPITEYLPVYCNYLDFKIKISGFIFIDSQNSLVPVSYFDPTGDKSSILFFMLLNSEI